MATRLHLIASLALSFLGEPVAPSNGSWQHAPTDKGLSDESLERHEFSHPAMGTWFRLVFYAPPQHDPQSIAAEAFQRLDELERTMSGYQEGSEISRLNAASRNHDSEPREVSPDLFRVLAISQEMSEITHGAFDITVGPLVEGWRRARRQEELPNADLLQARRRSVGDEFLSLDAESQSVHFLQPDMVLDLGGIGKGFALDEMLTVLRERGITRALIEGGGDIVTSSPPPEATAWRVAVQSLLTSDQETSWTLHLSHQAVASSGSTYQYVEIDGQRYSHLLDPRSGRPLPTGIGAVAVAPGGAHADALASALCVLGPKGITLVDQRSNWEGRVVFLEQGAARTCDSRGFRSMMAVADSHHASK